MPSSNKYTGLYNRGTKEHPRWWYRLRWPGEKVERRAFLSTDREIALSMFVKIKRQKEDLDKYGILQWDAFKDRYFKDNIKAKKTIEIDRWSLQKFEAAIHPKFLTDMNPQNLLLARNAWTREGGVRDTTIDTWKNRVVTVARWAEDMGFMPLANWRICKNTAKVTHRREAFTEDEYDKIMGAVSGKWRTALMLTSEAGLRRSEVFYLRWADLDLDGRIGQILARPGWSPKMESDDRRSWFVLTPRLRDYLVELKKVSKSEHVFADPDGKRLYAPEAITRYMGRISRRLGLRAFFHKFRHTYVTRLLDHASADMVAVRNAARHKSSATTELYDHTGVQKALRGIDFDIFPTHKTAHKEKRK